MILHETINLLKNKYKDYIETLTISEVRIGVFMTAIKLSDNSYGISSTVPNIQMNCNKKNRDFGDFTPNNIVGKKVIDLLETTKQNGIIDTLTVAVLNAVSSRIIENSNYKILSNTDPIDLIDLNSGKTITIVGAFHSYIQKISATNSKLYVLELNEDAFMEDDKKYYVPTSDYPKILPISDVVLITGLTLVNNTLDDLLKTVKPETQIIVSGPSSSFIPDVLFANNVKIIGSLKITNPELMLKVISEAGAGYHLFNYCAEKICIVND
ncbi:MAG: hypothetical protein A2033_05945 [Bacteroidetes bacterium GWA2_31_9]|nr:MAG: hypothetical protein A2033_05945 [Bacteroidetes bacterium GWA2_31_9]